MSEIVSSAEEMEAIGASIAKEIKTKKFPAIIYLHGDLGAGKTTLVRGALHELGHRGLAKSPTFTLVETYSLSPYEIYHFDLYRISDPEELDYIGIREFSTNQSICSIEWPELGQPMVPKPTLEIFIEYHPQGRRINMTVPYN